MIVSEILKKDYQLIYFDIDSKSINIPEILLELNNICKKLPSFVAISNNKEKAFDAFRYDFSDFILKPLTELSLRKSLLKYQKKNPPTNLKTICLKSNKDFRYLCVDDILFLKADNNTTDFYMSDGTVISAYKTLKTFECSLPNNFLRIHKSYIINSNCISRIHYGKSICTLTNNQYNLPFTKTFINNIDLINDLYHNNIIASN